MRWTWSAAALCCAAAAFLAWAAWREGDPIASGAPAPAGQQATASEDERPRVGFDLSPAEDYAEIVERPLFNRTRRPVAADETAKGGAGAAEETPAARIALSGIVLTRGRRVALLRIDDDPKIMHVAEGQEAGGWLVEAIRPDKVILRRGEAASEIALEYKKQGNASPAATGKPAPVAPGKNPGVADEDELQPE